MIILACVKPVGPEKNETEVGGSYKYFKDAKV